MATFKVISYFLLATATTIEAGILAPAFAPGPVITPAVAPVAYTRVIPQNVPPFANSVNIFSRSLSLPLTYAAQAPVFPGFLPPSAVATPFAAGAFPPPPLAAPAFSVGRTLLPPTPFAPGPFAADPRFSAPIAPVGPVGRSLHPGNPVLPAVAPAVASAYSPTYPPLAPGLPAPFFK